MFIFHIVRKKKIRISYTISSMIVAWETRLMENCVCPEPNQCYCKLNILIKAYIHPDFIALPVSYSKGRLVSVSCKAIPEFLVILQPLTQITTLGRSCFTERRAPLEA